MNLCTKNGLLQLSRERLIKNMPNSNSLVSKASLGNLLLANFRMNKVNEHSNGDKKNKKNK